MEPGSGFTDLLLTSHAGLPAFSHLLKSARLPAVFGLSLKAIPDSAIFLGPDRLAGGGQGRLRGPQGLPRRSGLHAAAGS